MTEQNFTSVMHLLDVLYKIWPIICGAIVVGLVWWRTRSFFFIFHQVLKWLGLEGKYTNADDQKVADDYLDLNKFNLKTGFHLKSVKAKAALHGWMREHDLEFAILKRAGRYFKANELEFEIPDKPQIYFTWSVICLIGVAFILGGQLVQRDDAALLRVKATGTWFWVSAHEAYSLNFDFPDWLRGDHWSVQQGDCRYTEGSYPTSDVWDKDVICRLVLGFNEDYIEQAIESQTYSAWILRLLGIGCLGTLGVLAYWLSSAKELQAELTKAQLHAEPINQLAMQESN